MIQETIEGRHIEEPGIFNKNSFGESIVLLDDATIDGQFSE